MQASEMGGLYIKYHKWSFRVWRYGYEWQIGNKGWTKFFPWRPRPDYE